MPPRQKETKRRQRFRYDPDPAERLTRPDTATGFPMEALRTPLWSSAERNIVLERVQNGCWSPMEISRQIGPSKSLRQVIEYLEYVHRSNEHIRLKEEDVESIQVTVEKRNKVDWKQTQERNAFLTKARFLRKNNDTPHFNNYNVFGAKKVRFLTNALNGGPQRILADDRVHLTLHKMLEEFLQKVLKDIITRYVVTKPFEPVTYLGKRYMKVDNDRFRVDEECVKQSIVACGFELGVPSVQLRDAILERYADKDKKMEILADMEKDEEEEEYKEYEKYYEEEEADEEPSDEKEEKEEDEEMEEVYSDDDDEEEDEDEDSDVASLLVNF